MCAVYYLDEKMCENNDNEKKNKIKNEHYTTEIYLQVAVISVCTNQ